jgi:HAD superfamily hydrolase (TIGR01509 family)
MTFLSQLDAVLFDCDGVLVDSESIANRALYKTLHDINLFMTEEEVADTFTGRSFPDCLKRIEERLGGPIPDGFVENNRRYFSELLMSSLEPMPGVPEMLAQLPLPFAVVTNSRKRELALKLECAGIDRFFSEERRFDTESVGIAKPDPGIYLHAAENLGLDIRRCLIVEDSHPGLTAATGSGARVWAYRPHPTGDELKAFDLGRVFDDWHQFLDLLHS